MIGQYRRELSVAVAYGIILVLLAVEAPRFFGPDQLRAFIVSSAPVLVAAVGMTLVILCRQIDISIGSIFSVCGVVAGLLAQAGLPIGAGRSLDDGDGRLAGVDQRRSGRAGGFAVDRRHAGDARHLAGIAALRARGRVRPKPSSRLSVVRDGASGRAVDRRVDRARGFRDFRLGPATTWRRADSFTRRVPTPRQPGWRASGPGE